MDFEVDSKTVVDNIYERRNIISDFGAFITNCRCLLATDLVTIHVRFIRIQTNGVARSLARAAPSLASFYIFINILTCIITFFLVQCTKTIIPNKMH